MAEAPSRRARRRGGRGPRRSARSRAGSPGRGSRPSTTWSSVRTRRPSAGKVELIPGRRPAGHRADVVGVVGGRPLEGGRQQLVDRAQVGQPRDAALGRARAERDEDRRLAPQQAGELLVLVVADPAREQGQVDRPVGHRRQVVVLGVHHRRPEDDLEALGEVEDRLVEVEDADVAATARRGPVHREAYGDRRARITSPPPRAPGAGRATMSRVPAEWAERADLVDDAPELVGEPLALGGAGVDPLEALPARCPAPRAPGRAARSAAAP